MNKKLLLLFMISLYITGVCAVEFAAHALSVKEHNFTGFKVISLLNVIGFVVIVLFVRNLDKILAEYQQRNQTEG